MLTALFTKPECLPLAGTVFRDCSHIHSLRIFFRLTEIVPDKAGNGSGGGFLNSVVIVLKEQTLTAQPLYSLLPHRTVSGGHSVWQLPLIF